MMILGLAEASEEALEVSEDLEDHLDLKEVCKKEWILQEPWFKAKISIDFELWWRKFVQ